MPRSTSISSSLHLPARAEMSPRSLPIPGSLLGEKKAKKASICTCPLQGGDTRLFLWQGSRAADGSLLISLPHQAGLDAAGRETGCGPGTPLRCSSLPSSGERGREVAGTGRRLLKNNAANKREQLPAGAGGASGDGRRRGRSGPALCRLQRRDAARRGMHGVLDHHDPITWGKGRQRVKKTPPP